MKWFLLVGWVSVLKARQAEPACQGSKLPPEAVQNQHVAGKRSAVGLYLQWGIADCHLLSVTMPFTFSVVCLQGNIHLRSTPSEILKESSHKCNSWEQDAAGCCKEALLGLFVCHI